MNQPAVGVGALILHKRKILLGRRRASHGAGCWATPGGHLAFCESPVACARREVQEETGLILNETVPGPWVNSVFLPENKHYITLFTVSYGFCGTLQRREPEKCDGWQWFDVNALPAPLFLPLEMLFKQYGKAWLFGMDRET